MKKLLFVFFLFFLLCFSEGFHIYSKGYYFYEKEDREWHINFKGKFSAFCGIYFILFNERGDIFYCGVIPYGDYSDKPYTIKIPEDKITGFYKGVLVGEERTIDSLILPLSDLEYEVYGGDYFATHYKDRLYFKVEKDELYVLGAYKGNLKVLNEKGEMIADTKITKKTEKYDNLTEFQAKKDDVYILEKECRYFRVKNDKKIFLSNDAKKLFIPDPALDKIEWWKIPLKGETK
ncbi:MAG: hypothetical protein NC934_00885 [Candidatus Omnitrophica bacterium]|nr:hypothetical protein [Candidatus Omnitrophota bacterium]